jgi:putative tryptophan/tyrosine transport system substrate-binding protein
MTACIRRREFITLLGGAVAGWPLAARAQQAVIPVVGFLSTRTAADSVSVVAAFHSGMKEVGFVDGQTVRVEYHWAGSQYDRLRELALDMVRARVAVITAVGPPAAVAAKAATATVPIVFTVGSDPVKIGLVANLGRPGGNATGVNIFSAELGAKRLGLLHDLMPAASTVALLVNPRFPNVGSYISEVEAAGRAIGWQIRVVNASNEGEIDAAFATMLQLHAEAVFVAADPFFTGRRDQIVELAARHAIPAVYEVREFPVAGGLMSYGTSLTDAYRLVGIYVGRILKGEKPADLPIIQPTKFELVINLNTAKALGLTFPPGLLAIADEVIE